MKKIVISLLLATSISMFANQEQQFRAKFLADKAAKSPIVKEYLNSEKRKQILTSLTPENQDEQNRRLVFDLYNDIRDYDETFLKKQTVKTNDLMDKKWKTMDIAIKKARTTNPEFDRHVKLVSDLYSQAPQEDKPEFATTLMHKNLFDNSKKSPEELKEINDTLEDARVEAHYAYEHPEEGYGIEREEESDDEDEEHGE